MPECESVEVENALTADPDGDADLRTPLKKFKVLESETCRILTADTFGSTGSKQCISCPRSH